MDSPRFLLVCCQPGAEAVLKAELAVNHPQLRFSFSRPGFLTFKWDDDQQPSNRWQLKSIFARTHAWSLGGVKAEEESERWEQLLVLLHAAPKCQHVHVWKRQPRRTFDATPEILTDETRELGQQLIQRARSAGMLDETVSLNQPARSGELVLDCVMLDPDQWWLGWHEVTTFAHRWPGGVPDLQVPDPMISRAYLKMQEAMLWSELPMRAGERCAEIGSAPGGASQALLERGVQVLGIDPAKMDERVLANPQFHHLRKRGAEVRRTELRGYRWLMVDSNIPADEMLEMVEALVTHRVTAFHGLLLTIKLMKWQDASRLANDVQRVRSWGFESVRCRQLASNHQEVCLAALRSRGMRRRRTTA
jgi:23S rRNA (cytidine2498-2'-O)-methyltransferase